MIRNYQKNGVDINLTPIYQSISGLKTNIAELESLTTLSSLTGDILNLNSSIISLNNDVLNINSSLSDITNSLSTLTGGFTTPYFNDHAFNTTLNFYSDMFFTGIFSLPKSTLNYTQAYWNLSNLKSVYVSYINAQTINDLSVYNFGFGDCKILCRTCHFDKCEFRWCTLSAWNIGKLENCKVGLSCRFEKCSDWEFSNVNFSYSSCGFASGSRIRFENVNFNSDFKCGLSNNDYIIYLHDCLINSSTFETTALSNIFTCDHSIQFIV